VCAADPSSWDSWAGGAGEAGYVVVVGGDGCRPGGGHALVTGLGASPPVPLSARQASIAGWHPSIVLKVGLASTYEWFRTNIASLE